jgi:O-antigen ligase
LKFPRLNGLVPRASAEKESFIMFSGVTKSIAAFLFLLAIFGTGIAAVILGPNLNPWASTLVVLTPAIIVLGIRRFPGALIPPVIFMGNFKSKAAEGFDLSDPTFVCLALVFVTVTVNLFFFYVQAHRLTLRYLFAGQGKVISCFLGLELLVAISYLYTVNPEYGQILVMKFLTIDLLLFLVPLLLFRDERDFRDFALMTVALAVPLAAYRIYVVLTTTYESNLDITQISAGHLIGMSILLVVNYRITEVPWLRVLIFLTLPLLTAGLIASDARGPALACLVMVCLSAFKRRGAAGFFAGKLAKLAIVAVVILTVAVTVQRMATTGSQHRVNEKAAELKQLLSGEAPRGTAGDRIWAYAAAISGFAKKPLQGWGAGGSQTYLATHSGIFGIYGGDLKLKYPHNVVLQVAMEQGILGFLLLLSFLWLIVKTARRIYRATAGRLSCFLWIVLFNLCVMMFSGDLDDSRAIWLWCGITLAISRMLVVGSIPEQPVIVDRPARNLSSTRFAYERVS